jgi:hypothetical protein
MTNLTNSLNQMIAHQRRAESCQGEAQDYHFREAMRYRAMAYKLNRQAVELRRSVGGWLNLN